jgi:cob(I)alamin adenosyltransferase
MGISTFSGDDGKTSLLEGGRVWKDDKRVEALGAIDELDSHLAEAVHLVGGRERASLGGVREALTLVSALLAGADPDPDAEALIAATDTLTAEIAGYEAETPIRDFAVTGNLPASAKIDLCRATARRAERRLVTLFRSGSADTGTLRLILAYLNRLSDLLFMAARSVEAGEGKLVFRSGKKKKEEKRD